MANEKDIILRPAILKAEPGVKTDTPLIFNSWIKSYENSPAVRGADHDRYCRRQHVVIEDILLRGATILIACYPDMPEHILGWVCLEKYESSLVVHYLWVRRGTGGYGRRQGIAKDMMTRILHTEKPDQIFFTHKTKDVFEWESRLNKSGWEYHPFLAFSPPTTGETFKKEEKNAA